MHILSIRRFLYICKLLLLLFLLWLVLNSKSFEELKLPQRDENQRINYFIFIFIAFHFSSTFFNFTIHSDSLNKRIIVMRDVSCVVLPFTYNHQPTSYEIRVSFKLRINYNSERRKKKNSYKLRDQNIHGYTCDTNMVTKYYGWLLCII